MVLARARYTPLMKHTKDLLKDASAQLASSGSASSTTAEPKKRKWFGGVAKILAGGAMIAGNLVAAGLTTGASLIPALSAKGTAQLLSCGAFAVPLIGQGIEDLRGA